MALITLFFLSAIALIVAAFIQQQFILLAAGALLLSGLIIAEKWPLLLPLAISLGALALLYTSADWPLELIQRQALGAILGANAGYGIAYCWLKLFTARPATQ